MLFGKQVLSSDSSQHRNIIDGYNKGDRIELSNDFWKCFKEICWAEFGDKTFCLIIIFTLSWCNTNYDKDDMLTKDLHFHVNPVSVGLAALLSKIMMVFLTIFRQRNVYENSSRFVVSTACVVMLLYYMYSLCNHNLEILKLKELKSQLDQSASDENLRMK